MVNLIEKYVNSRGINSKTHSECLKLQVVYIVFDTIFFYTCILTVKFINCIVRLAAIIIDIILYESYMSVSLDIFSDSG